jgi:hypothetical protein
MAKGEPNHISMELLKDAGAQQVVSPELIRCGQQVLAAVARESATGAPVVKCQLLASAFFEALKHELAQTSSADVAARQALVAAAVQCLRTARAAISPKAMLEQLQQAVIILEGNRAAPQPFLRVIEGGRSDKSPLPAPAQRLRGI